MKLFFCDIPFKLNISKLFSIFIYFFSNCIFIYLFLSLNLVFFLFFFSLLFLSLLSAMNPCSCGYYPDMNRCRCSRTSIQRYIGKISQPLLDRIDVCVEAPTLDYASIISKDKNESSAEIRERVVKCHELQKARFKGLGFNHNSEIPGNMIDDFCKLDIEGTSYMKDMYERYALTARTYHKVLKVARTIADMEEANNISLIHLQEAIAYRGLDKKYWEEYV